MKKEPCIVLEVMTFWGLGTVVIYQVIFCLRLKAAIFSS